MLKINLKSDLKNVIEFILEVEKINMLELSKEINLSRTTLLEISKGKEVSNIIYEKIYSYLYSQNYRLNKVKEEILKEKYNKVLFHGSKDGLSIIDVDKSRSTCDFGKGFYLGETYNQALSFVCEKENSLIYSFECDLNNLKIKEFNCDLEWMIAICYFRGTILKYSNTLIVKKIIKELENVDLIIAPIADNKMFYIMSLFAEGEINSLAAIHSLSASSLGKQYVFKTDKALNQLKPLEKYYICKEERTDCRKQLNERAFEIDTKLKLAKREFRDGLYIEEILK